MTFSPCPKIKRIQDTKLLERVKKQRCAATKKFGTEFDPIDPHHITTKKAGGGDTKENIIPLLRSKHIEWHYKGAVHMIEKYQGVRDWLWLHKRFDILERVKEKYA